MEFEACRWFHETTIHKAATTPVSDQGQAFMSSEASLYNDSQDSHL